MESKSLGRLTIISKTKLLIQTFLILVFTSCKVGVSFFLQQHGSLYFRGSLHGTKRPQLPLIRCRSNKLASNAEKDTRKSKIKSFLLEWFQGDFDNYHQVIVDRQNNLLPREGGGHEHFHCTLVPVTETSRLAAFFFDGNPERIFRFRYYELIYNDIISTNDDENETSSIEMRLYTLHPDLEKLLKTHSDDPNTWPKLFKEYQTLDPIQKKVELLPKCEIAWSLKKDPILHSYALKISESDGNGQVDSVHAVMVHGEAIVNSTIVPGMTIRILDQLSLYPNVFYINDRGFDPITGAFIYGNHRNIPYRLERVSHFVETPSSNVDNAHRLERRLINKKLEWTLGPKWRTEEEYESKLNVIGGPSAGINKKGYKSKGWKKDT